VVDVIVSPDSLSLVGGPSSVNVEVDFGPAGTRGSQIFVGRGQPNNPATVIGQTPNILDLYINLAPATIDDEYLNVYQYQSIDGSNSWVRLFDLLPESLSVKRLATFTTGSAVLNIPIADITSIVDGLTSQNFNVQFSIEGSKPVAAAISLSITQVSQVQNLSVSITASELTGSTWAALSGNKTVNLFITMV
jgi:hypothetical protein